MPVPLGLSLGAGALGVAAAGLAWGAVEAHAFALRRVSVGVLPAGMGELKVLHLSDLHMTAAQKDKVEWVRSLARLEPDLVVVTGDNLGAADAVPAVERALGAFSGTPGVFVFGSNDYFAPKPINPFQYFGGPSRLHGERQELPVEELRATLAGFGWVDLNNARARVTVGGRPVSFVGLDDPHIGRDKVPAADSESLGANDDLRIGVVHAPYARALEALAADGAAIVFAGHTHGGQVCVPGYGALVTNCDLARRQAKGLSRWRGSDRLHTWLHVSAGLGTSPFVPLRFACRPEATLVTLSGADRA